MNQRLLPVFFILLIHIAFWFILTPPTPKTDDLVYVWNAKMLAAGEYHLTDSPKNHRLTVIAPVAVLIKLFGESPYIIGLWPLLCSLASIALLYFFLEKYASQLIAFLAAFLIACNPLQINYSIVLFPDVIVALFAFLVIAEIFKSRREAESEKVGKWEGGIKAAVFFYAGFLAKETIVLLIPFVVFLFIADIKQKHNILFWKKFWLIMFSFAIILSAVYYFLTGDIIFIYHSINSRHNEVFALFSKQELIKRFTYEPAVYLLKSIGFSILIVFFLWFISIAKRKEIKLSSTAGFFSIYFLILLATYWWMPTSFQHLSPVLLVGYDRMWMLLLIPLSVLAAFAVEKAIEEKGSRYLLILVLLFSFTFLVALIFISKERALMFLLFVIGAGVATILKQRGFVKRWVISAILLWPVFVTALYFCIRNSNH